MRTHLINKAVAAILLITGTFFMNSCKDEEATLDRDKFIGSYDYTQYATIYFGSLITHDTTSGIFFIEVPNASLGLGDNYIAIKPLGCNDCTSYATVLGNDFLFDGSVNQENITGTGTTANGGQTLSIDFERGGISGTVATVTATKR